MRRIEHMSSKASSPRNDHEGDEDFKRSIENQEFEN
jgi:hypothetical protein